ncbi:MAG: hypothetical protein ACJATN_002597 [Neolewinella sp.]|jgi:hypothetical protein
MKDRTTCQSYNGHFLKREKPTVITYPITIAGHIR